MSYADAVSGPSQIGTICGLSSSDGFLLHVLSILILINDPDKRFDALIQGGSRMR